MRDLTYREYRVLQKEYEAHPPASADADRVVWDILRQPYAVETLQSVFWSTTTQDTGSFACF